MPPIPGDASPIDPSNMAAKPAAASADELLLRAVRSGKVWEVKRLLAAGATGEPEPLLIAAIHANKPSVFRLLASAGVPMGYELGPLKSALAMATYFNKGHSVRAMIKYGAPINAECLPYAVYVGNLKIVRLLLELGADPNTKSGDGHCPAHVVDAIKGTRQADAIALALLDHGADPFKRDVDGNYPDHWVFERAREERSLMKVAKHARAAMPAAPAPVMQRRKV